MKNSFSLVANPLLYNPLLDNPLLDNPLLYNPLLEGLDCPMPTWLEMHP